MTEIMYTIIIASSFSISNEQPYVVLYSFHHDVDVTSKAKILFPFLPIFFQAFLLHRRKRLQSFSHSLSPHLNN